MPAGVHTFNELFTASELDAIEAASDILDMDGMKMHTSSHNSCNLRQART